MRSIGWRFFTLGWLILLAGCATDVSLSGKNKSTEANRIQFQRMGSAPESGAADVTSLDLQPGDILLSSSTGINSLGIRIFSLAPVSHAAIYLGEEQVAEATSTGVNIVSLNEAIDHNTAVIAFRYPGLTPEHAAKLREFALDKEGSDYNFGGIVLIAPYMITKRICELPLFNATVRNHCLSQLATVQLGDGGSLTEDQRFFCSQFVLEAYNYAGHPISDSNPVWITPADLLHMREGDSSSFRSNQPLSYIGHLKQRSSLFTGNKGLAMNNADTLLEDKSPRMLSQ